MKSRLLQLLLAVTLVLGGYWWGHSSVTVVHAQAQAQLSIPKSYGKLVGTVGSGFIFEDSTGTLRLIDAGTGQFVQAFTRN